MLPRCQHPHLESRNSAPTSLLTALALFATLVPGALTQGPPPQKVHRADFEPATDEVFTVLTQFYDFDGDLPLDPRTVDEWDAEEARFQKVVFTTSSGERVPGDLALPKEGQPPYPAVLLLHGLGNDRDRWWKEDREALPKALLAAGIAVLTLDLRFHGERSAENDYQNPVYLTFGNTLHVRNRNMVIQSTLDSRRALALLRERKDIDGDRLAVMGYSMGGMIILFLTALEEPLAAAVVSAVPTTQQPAPIDHFQFAARGHAPVLLQVGRSDWLSSPEDGERLRELIPKGRGETLFYDAGHRLPPQFAVDAAEWLQRKLRR